MDRRFLAGARAGLDAAARECGRVCSEQSLYIGEPSRGFGWARASPLALAIAAIREIDPTKIDPIQLENP